MKLAQGMSEEFYKECFQLHCYVQQYEKTGFFFVILLLICNPLKENFYSFKKRKHTLLSYAIAAARRFKCDLGLFVELLEFSEDRSLWESAEEKLTAIW